MTTSPVIARIVPARERERSPDAEAGHVSLRDVEIFLPYEPANPGCVGVWSAVDGHGEASLEYYRATKPPRTDAEREAVTALVLRYRAWMASIPVDDREAVVELQRFPHDWRAHAWGAA